MPVYMITVEHLDEDGWHRHAPAHAAWLQDRVHDGSLLASGPFREESLKAAVLIMSAPDRSTVESLIATDPFAQEGLNDNTVIREWDPIFGAFNHLSTMPGRF